MCKKAVGILTVLTTLLLTTPCYANDVKDIYKVYQIPYTLNAEPEVLETIKNYQEAELYVAKNKHLVQVKYNRSDMYKSILEAEARLRVLQEQLKSCYYASESEIYQKETEYLELKENYHVLMKQYALQQTDLPDFNISHVPTQEEYRMALVTRDKALDRTVLGASVNLPYPVNNKAVMIETKDNITTLKTLDKTKVTTFYNGEVTKVTEDTITVTSDDVIAVTYAAIVPEVNVGDIVKAGECIATTQNNYLSLQLCIEGTPYDISRLLEEKK